MMEWCMKMEKVRKWPHATFSHTAKVEHKAQTRSTRSKVAAQRFDACALVHLKKKTYIAKQLNSYFKPGMINHFKKNSQ